MPSLKPGTAFFKRINLYGKTGGILSVYGSPDPGPPKKASPEKCSPDNEAIRTPPWATFRDFCTTNSSKISNA